MSEARATSLADNFVSQLQGSSDPVWSILSRLSFERVPARVLFVSVEPRAGTTGIAAATALGLASNLRVEVGIIETNIERPALARHLRLMTEGGLSDILDRGMNIEQCVRSIAVQGSPDLRVLPAGSARKPFPGELASPVGQAIFEQFVQRGRYFLIDAAPILTHPETRYLLRYADGAILVLRAGHTRRKSAEKALQILADSNVPVLGTVLNRFQSEELSFRIAGLKVF